MFGTTNSESGYLRDITGNRRFWTVNTPGNAIKKPWDLKGSDIQQIWAEALSYVKAGEKLYLTTDLEELAKAEQREAMEVDEREGIVLEYLDRLLPDNWDDMDIYTRQDYIRSPDGPTLPKGTILRRTVSNMEIWCECFGKHKEDIRLTDSYAIAAIMRRATGWEKTDKTKRLNIYGKQRIYERI